MANSIRALVIALEDYPAAEGLSRRLEGTHEAAEAFITWLKEKKGVPAGHIHYCASEGRPGRTAGTLRSDIAREVRALADSGRNRTEELYVFFSGHGFSFREGPGGAPADILVTSDFTRAADSGGACVRLRELQEKLQGALGPGDHYYFVDACRNLVSEDELEPTRLGVKLEASMLGIGTLFTLYSTARQAVARVDSGFSRHLLKGLHGHGRAKGWVGQRMYVTFDLLRRYVRAKLNGQEASVLVAGSGDGHIIELQPVPRSDCQVYIRNATGMDSFTLRVNQELGGRRLLVEETPFQGSETKLSLLPGDYVLEVRHPEAAVTCCEPHDYGRVDAYEPCVVRFHKAVDGEDPVAADDLPTRIRTGSRMVVSRLTSGRPPAPGAPQARPPKPGGPGHVPDTGWPKAITVKRLWGGAPRPRALRAAPGAPGPGIATPPGWPPSSRRFEALISAPALGALGAGCVMAPEQLPELFSQAPRLRLSRALLGAGHKESWVYVLACFTRGVSKPRIALEGGAALGWHSMQRMEEFTALWEGAISAPAGPSVLSVQFSSSPRPQATLSYSTWLLPGHATLVTLSEGARGEPELHQYFLPLRSLMDRLPSRYTVPLRASGIGFVQILCELQQHFAHKRTVSASLGIYERRLWREVLSGEWLEPNLALLGSYELLRRRRGQERVPSLARIGLNNLLLRHFFPGLPDTDLTAKLAGLPFREPTACPLYLDGLLAWEDAESRLPLPPEKLTYEGPWVMWRNAVPLPPATG